MTTLLNKEQQELLLKAIEENKNGDKIIIEVSAEALKKFIIERTEHAD